MHPSSFENIQYCLENYVLPSSLMQKSVVNVLDVGGADVNGSYRDIFQSPPFRYLAADISIEKGVDIVSSAYGLPLFDDSTDIVLSGQMFEHCEFFWKAFQEMVRVLNKDGFLFLIAPSAGPIHRYPVDCYRFHPDSFKALADYTGCHIVRVWSDERGPWNDVIGVFSKSSIHEPVESLYRKPDSVPIGEIRRGTPEEESVRGEKQVHEVIETVHKRLEPRSYLEIGVWNGRSLSIAQCEAFGVDPYPEITYPLPEKATIFPKGSDAFFGEDAESRLSTPPDLVFIDGMHHFEYALRDFMNAEKYSHSGTVVLVDDIYPVHPRQAKRERETHTWTGDVWKLLGCLRTHRPDLFLLPLDTSPTGLLLIAGLNSKKRILWDRYNPIVRYYNMEGPQEPGSDILQREGAFSPVSAEADRALDILRKHRDGSVGPAGLVELLRSKPRKNAPPAVDSGDSPKLSVVVVAYNMRRELPRTLLSLSAAMQKGISPEEYEIIVIDNGSTDPFDEDACRKAAGNVFFHKTDSPSSSPAAAANFGISLAKAGLVGVFIDGARLASPGLLKRAVDAARIDSRTVIGACGFHLGLDVQMKSVKNGYDQQVEDRMLAASGWENDGYRLFDISCFAGSSEGGWFRLPAETNSLFMSKSLWKELGGYDAAFSYPGGGLCNLDVWSRALDLPAGKVVMLLGEGTFHQVHGGAATSNLFSYVEMEKEYRKIRGVPYRRPDVIPIQFGCLHPKAEALETDEKRRELRPHMEKTEKGNNMFSGIKRLFGKR